MNMTPLPTIKDSLLGNDRVRGMRNYILWGKLWGAFGSDQSRRFQALLFFIIAASTSVAANAAFNADQLALVINDSDPISIEIGEYYAERRKLPANNVIHVDLPHDKPVISSGTFNRVFEEVKKRTPAAVQAYALTWVSPYRVDCMSITSAFAMGYARRYCAQGCRATAPNPYFNSSSQQPFDDFGIRPAMVVAARTIENARSLIDRGIHADYSKPAASAYLVTTADKARNSRSPSFALIKRRFSSRVRVSIVQGAGIRDKFDIMFYFIGAKHVPHLDSIGFLPGAIADHLTSAGGRLPRSNQMSVLRWLEAGATGSYGTVVEPCNFPQKFPDPALAIENYLAGDTLIEAYWKSVVWPGQGIFVGEPLARPYANQDVRDSTTAPVGNNNE